jgi:site-specific recombinase XerD
LDDNGYEFATEYLELTTIKQVVRFLIAKQYLPESCRFEYPVKKPTGTDTYCYSVAEVTAMIARCRAAPERHWLGDVMVGLAHTGLRISELAQSRWGDIDLVSGVIRLPDASLRGTRDDRATARRTKGKRERELPIHPTLRETLEKIYRHTDGRVFHGPRGGSLKPDTVRNALIREVIVPLADRFPATSDEPCFRDGRLHSMRHYFCSMCANNGVPEQMLMDWLGHRHSSMVRRYYHSNREEAQRRMQKISFTGPSNAGIYGEGPAGNRTTAEPEVNSTPGTPEYSGSDQKQETAA